jgi:DNA-directed RNA polymerase subunit RPC12/RpoP
VTSVGGKTEVVWEGGDMSRENLICSECGERYESDLFTEDPSETFVCPMCGTLILTVEPAIIAAAAANQAAARAHA